MIRIYLPKGKTKRFLVFFVFVILMISSMWGAIYVSVNTGSSLGISSHIESIQLMAVDYNSSGELVLQKEGGVHRLRLDTWIGGSEKTYPAAFALVNPANRSFNIRSIRLRGNPKYVNIYLHQNMTRPANSTIVQIPPESCEPEEHKQIYYTNGTSIEYEAGGWLLGPGEGYGEGLVYKNATQSSTASLVNDVWNYNSAGPLEAENGTANFVWVEINIYPPLDVVSKRYTGPLIIDIDIDYIPSAGQVIDFMAAGRRDGGYVMSRDINASVRFSIDGLKPGMNLSIPDAFAIVNTGGSPVRLTKIEVAGDTNGYLRIYAHKNYTRPCDPDISNIPLDGCDPDNQLYYNGTSLEWNDNGWVIGSGQGYNETGNLIYTDNGQMDRAVTATRKGGYPGARHYFWVYDENPTTGSNIADNSTANFVWIEISVVIPQDVEETSVDADIIFHFKSL